MGRAPAVDVIAATADEAARGIPRACADNVTAVNFGGLDVEDFRALQCVVMGYDEDPGVLLRLRRAYTWTESHGPWLDECPAEFVVALAEIQPERFREIGLQWWERLWLDEEKAVRAEMLAGTQVDSLEQDVGVLVSIARGALREGKGLYWVVPGC